MRTVLGVLGIVTVVAATSQPIGAQETAGGKADRNSKSWEAVAPGLVEARSGEIKIWAPVIGRISGVPVNANDKVLAILRAQHYVAADDREYQPILEMAQKLSLF